MDICSSIALTLHIFFSLAVRRVPPAMACNGLTSKCLPEDLPEPELLTDSDSEDESPRLCTVRSRARQCDDSVSEAIDILFEPPAERCCVARPPVPPAVFRKLAPRHNIVIQGDTNLGNLQDPVVGSAASILNCLRRARAANNCSNVVVDNEAPKSSEDRAVLGPRYCHSTSQSEAESQKTEESEFEDAASPASSDAQADIWSKELFTHASTNARWVSRSFFSPAARPRAQGAPKSYVMHVLLHAPV